MNHSKNQDHTSELKNTKDWELLIIRALSKEFDHICWVHKIKLRPSLIMLFDSETRWGVYNSQARSISISRKLVREHPWHHVIGVLLHEMAHQYIDEHASTRNAPHGEPFKIACKKLGVPAQYAKAGLDLSSNSLDWRSEPHDQATEKILEKAKKLLVLAQSENIYEAQVAMGRVRELYAKYNLEQLSAAKQESFYHQIVAHKKKRVEVWQQRTMSILPEHFFVKVLVFKQFNPRTGEQMPAFEIIGARENVLMAEYVYHFLIREVDSLLKKTSKSRPLSRTQRVSFRLGILDGFENKLKLAESVNPENTNPSNACKELSIVGEALEKFRKNRMLDDYLDEIYPRLTSRKLSSQYVDDQAFAAGHKAGRSINLNRPLANAPSNNGKLLGQKYF